MFILCQSGFHSKPIFQEYLDKINRTLNVYGFTVKGAEGCKIYTTKKFLY